MRKCFICKKKDEPAVMFIDGLRATCRTPECMSKYSLWKLEKDRDKKAKAERKEDRERKDRFYSKDVSWQHKNTQRVFNRSRVLQEIKWFHHRGLEPECISCGKNNMDWCCGHLKTVGSAGILRYDRVNTYLQCNRYCNMGLSGNISGNKNTRGYIQGLKDRFGESRAKEILEYCEEKQHGTKRWSCDEVSQIRCESNKIIKSLKNDC